MVAEGNLKGCGKKIVIIACYLPPKYTVPRGREAMDCVAGMISDAKRQHDDPYVLVAGRPQPMEVGGSPIGLP